MTQFLKNGLNLDVPHMCIMGLSIREWAEALRFLKNGVHHTPME
jgi:hypothetical protein